MSKAKKSVSDLDFSFGDDGELELTGFSEDDVFEEEEELFDEEEAEEVEEEEVQEEDQASDFETRLSAMEKSIQSIPQMVTNAIVSAMGNNQNKVDEDEDEVPEELDNKQMVNILAKRMEKAVKKEVGTIMQQNEPALKEARLTAEFRAAASKYGQKFIDRMVPVAQIINRVEKSGGKISAEDAFLSVKDLPVANKQGASRNVKQQSKPKSVKVDADSDDSVGDINQVPGRPKMDTKKIKEMSDADMFQQAFNGAMLSHVRGVRRRA